MTLCVRRTFITVMLYVGIWITWRATTGLWFLDGEQNAGYRLPVWLFRTAKSIKKTKAGA